MKKCVNGVEVDMTPEEIAAFQAIVNTKDPNEYKQKRRLEYPEIGDQLDAIWKVIQANNLTISAEGQALLMQIETTKNKYPKGA